MLSVFVIFFGSIKIKATIVHILQPTPNVLEVKEAFHYIFCWPRAVLIALLYWNTLMLYFCQSHTSEAEKNIQVAKNEVYFIRLWIWLPWIL